MKLFHMLEQLEVSGFAHVISFQPHGRAIRIHNPIRFQNEVLPLYFPDNKNLGSFLRQLNIYGFRRMINNGPDRDSYYHAMFLHGRPDLCSLIERPIKSLHSKRQKYDPLTEPIFYNMPMIRVFPSKSIQEIESNQSSQSQQILQWLNCFGNLTETPISNTPFAPTLQSNVYSATATLTHGAFDNPFFATTYNDGSHLPVDVSPDMYHEQTQDSSNVSLLSGLKSDSERHEEVPLTDIEDTPIASFMLSRNTALPFNNTAHNATTSNGHNTKAIPASVVVAATSLLANQQEPQLSSDPCISIIDQYCLHLATKILSQTCLPLPSPSNSRHEEEQGQSMCDNRQQQPSETDSSISPLPLKRPSAKASSTYCHNDKMQFSNCDIGSQHDGNDSTEAIGSRMGRF